RRPAEVNALALQPDGRVIVGGRFTSFNGRACDGVVRLNPDGSIDESFRLGTGQPTDVRALLLEPDGEIRVGGFFDGLYGKSGRRTAGNFWLFVGRHMHCALECGWLTGLNISLAGHRSNGAGLSGASGVTALALEPDGKIFAGGRFSVVQNGRYRELDLVWLN